VTLSQPPRRTLGPSLVPASAMASVVLPTPASPPRNTSRPLPPAASASNPSSEARKFARSINTSVIKALVNGEAKEHRWGRAAEERQSAASWSGW
jgi:hypothetical protein